MSKPVRWAEGCVCLWGDVVRTLRVMVCGPMSDSVVTIGEERGRRTQSAVGVTGFVCTLALIFQAKRVPVQLLPKQVVMSW